MKKLIILFSLQFAIAQIPHKMSFQAYLTDNNNMPIAPGSYEMTFRIYDASSDGNKLWEETQTVDVDGSMVSTMLGSAVPLIALNKPGFLEIQLKDEVLTPRQELGGSMFAIKAAKAVKAIKADTAHIAVGYAKIDALSTYAKLDTLSAYAKNSDMVLDTDDQTLKISGDTLYISEGNFVLLSSRINANFTGPEIGSGGLICNRALNLPEFSEKIFLKPSGAGSSAFTELKLTKIKQNIIRRKTIFFIVIFKFLENIYNELCLVHLF